jgi:hypothetical protein
MRRSGSNESGRWRRQPSGVARRHKARCNRRHERYQVSRAHLGGRHWLLRPHFPKGTDLSVHSQAYLNKVARQLNEQPYETLQFETLAERFNAIWMPAYLFRFAQKADVAQRGRHVPFVPEAVLTNGQHQSKMPGSFD